MDDDNYNHYTSYKHRLHDISTNISSTLGSPTRTPRSNSYFDFDVPRSSAFESPGRNRYPNSRYLDHDIPYQRSRSYTDGSPIKQRYEDDYWDSYSFDDSYDDWEQYRHYPQRKPVRTSRRSADVYDRYSDDEQPRLHLRREPPRPTASRSTIDHQSPRVVDYPLRDQRRRSTTNLARTPHIRESEKYPRQSYKAQGTKAPSRVRERARRPVAGADFDSEDSDDSSLDGHSRSPPAQQSPTKTPPAIASALQLSLLPQNYEKQNSVHFIEEGSKSSRSSSSRNIINSNTNNDTSHTTSEYSSYRTSSSAAGSLDRESPSKSKPRPRFPGFLRSFSSFSGSTTPIGSPGSLNQSDGSITSPNLEKRRSFFSFIPASSFTKIDSASETSSLSSGSTASSLGATHTIMTRDDLRHDPEAHTLTSLSKIWCFRELNSPETEWTAFDIKNQKLLTAYTEKMASNKAGTEIDDEVKFFDSHIFERKKKVRIFPDKNCGCYTGNTRDDTVVLLVECLEVKHDTQFVYKNKKAK